MLIAKIHKENRLQLHDNASPRAASIEQEEHDRLLQMQDRSRLKDWKDEAESRKDRREERARPMEQCAKATKVRALI